jgi:TolB protein
MLAFAGARDGHSHVIAVDLTTGSVSQLTTGSTDHGSVSWFPDGEHLLYSESDGDSESIWITDRGGRSSTEVASGDHQSYVLPVLSPDGFQVAFFSTRDGHWAIFLMPARGGPQHAITDNTVFEGNLSWAPDGSAIAFTPWRNTESPPFIGIAFPSGEDFSVLFSGPQWNSNPRWSPDGERIAFRCDVGNLPQICTIRPDGSDLRQLTSGPGGNLDAAWSPDSQQIAFVSWRDSARPATCEDGDCDFEVYVMAADGSNQLNLSHHPAEDWGPTWSPDGASIAFVSLRDEPMHPSQCGDTCNSEIYVMDSLGDNARRITQNTEPDWNPVWRPIPSP